MHLFPFPLLCVSQNTGLTKRSILVIESQLMEGANIFSAQMKVHSKASKLYQLRFGAMSNIGVRWHLTYQKNAQISASDIAVFKIATKCRFFAKYGKLFDSFYSIWLYQKFIEHILSLTDKFCKQLILLNNFNFF